MLRTLAGLNHPGFARTMTALVHVLSAYADYHRDRRNIATHLIGVPMIVAGVAVLLSRPQLAWGELALSPAVAVAAAAALWYLRLDRRYGAVMALLLAAAVALGQASAGGSLAAWGLLGGGLFVAGWVIQFIGHAFEGRKPAFVDDLIGLLVGPLFVVAEIGFTLGLRREVHAAVTARSGPVRTGPPAAPTAV